MGDPDKRGADPAGGSSARDGLDREYASMGTGEAGGGTGGGGASSSDVEWDDDAEKESTGSATTSEQDVGDPVT